jgi:CRISPR/Cas system-associated exonuclease Cas4 (RecB family)
MGKANMFEDSATIVENQLWRDRFLSEARAFLGRPRQGIHVTDLVFPRRAYFRIKHPEVMPTEEEVGRYIAGRGHHHVLEVLAALPEYREVEVAWNGIEGHIDVFEDAPVEIKTTRALRVASAEEIKREYPFWIRQLGYYCAMTGKRKGRLVVFYLNVPTNSKNKIGLIPRLSVFEVEFRDLEEIKREMSRLKEALQMALDTDDPSGLEPCPSWMCEDCRFAEMCKQGNEGSANFSP